MNCFLPKDRVYIKSIECSGIVTQVRITTYGTEYLVRYFDDKTPMEAFLYDFEVEEIPKQESRLQQI